MKQFIFTAVCMLGISALADEGILPSLTAEQEQALISKSSKMDHRDRGNFCRVTQPGERDRYGRFCNYSYGVMWDGYIINNRCFNSLEAAFAEKNSQRICSYSPPARFGQCQILAPNIQDRSGRFCNGAHAFTFEGFIVDNSCFADVSATLDRMLSTRACVEGSYRGRCRILQPGERDRSGRFCNQSYGVAFDGFITDNKCYFNLDEAFNEMNSASYCH